MDINLQDLISPEYTEPTFSVNFHQLARPGAKNRDNYLTPTILKTNRLACWRIIDERLVKLTEPTSIFFDRESYLIQWLFDLKLEDDTISEEFLVYHWKGRNAIKGFTPLPSDIEEHCPVERIVQWSEPAIFFHVFPQALFVFSGESSGFDNKLARLLIARGELQDELHFYEVPLEKRSLRSRAVFLLIDPGRHSFIIWQGRSVRKECNVNIIRVLQKWQKDWADFSVQTIKEGEDAAFLGSLRGGDYCSIALRWQFTPKLFYLNSIGGKFSATRVEYPLRVEDVTAPFPFLQSHLYTATQPALFLLDNYTEVYLWEGDGTSLGIPDSKKFQEEVASAKKLTEYYIVEKQGNVADKIVFYHVYAKKEPLEFQNVFPAWN